MRRTPRWRRSQLGLCIGRCANRHCGSAPCECIQAARGNSAAVQVLPVVIVVIMQIQVLALHGLDIADFDYR